MESTTLEREPAATAIPLADRILTAALARMDRISREMADPAKLECIQRLTAALEEMPDSMIEERVHAIDHALTCLDRFTGLHFALLAYLRSPRDWFGQGTSPTYWVHPAKRWSKPHPRGHKQAGEFESMPQSLLGDFIRILMPDIDKPSGMLRAIAGDMAAAGLVADEFGLSQSVLFDRFVQPWVSPLGEAVCQLIFSPPAIELSQPELAADES